MQNIAMSLEGTTLVIKIDLTKEYGSSTSGKSKTVASTSGNVSVPGHDKIKIGINVYKPVRDS